MRAVSKNAELGKEGRMRAGDYGRPKLIQGFPSPESGEIVKVLFILVCSIKEGLLQ